MLKIISFTEKEKTNRPDVFIADLANKILLPPDQVVP